MSDQKPEKIWVVIDTETKRADHEYLGAFRNYVEAVKCGLEHAKEHLDPEMPEIQEPLDYTNPKTIRSIVDLLAEEHVFLKEMLLI